MNCQEFQHRLDALLDERAPLAADGPLAEHGAACAACARQLAAYERLTGALACLRTEAPDDMAARVLRQYDEELVRPEVVRTRWRLARLWIGGAVVAASIALLALHWSLRTLDIADPDPPGTARNVPEAPREVHARLPQQPALGTLAREATDRYRDLASEARGSFAAAIKLVPPLEETPATLVESEEPAAIASQMADGLEPITSSGGDAIGFLSRVLPGTGGSRLRVTDGPLPEPGALLE